MKNSMFWWITVASGPVFVEYKKAVSIHRVQRDHTDALEIWAANASGLPASNPDPPSKKKTLSIENGNWSKS